MYIMRRVCRECIDDKERKYMKKRFVSIVLALWFGLSVPAGAAWEPSFSDVREGHWAYTYIEMAAADHWISGYGDGRFGPDDQVTYAQLAAMLLQTIQAFQKDLDAYAGPTEPWYIPYCTVGSQVSAGILDNGLFDGTDIQDSYMDAEAVCQPINRYEMAQMIHNATWWMTGENYTAQEIQTIQAGIADWAQIPTKYQESIFNVSAYGIISGMDSQGTFAGSSYMSRAQAAAVLARVKEVSLSLRPVEKGYTGEMTIYDTPPAGMLRNGKPVTEANVVEMLRYLQTKYPMGMIWYEPWTNPDTFSNPNTVSRRLANLMEGGYGTSAIYGCGGFAAMISDLIFPEDMPPREVTDFSAVRPGDIVIEVSGKTGDATHVWVAVGNSWFSEKAGAWQVKGRAHGNYGHRIYWEWDSNALIRSKQDVPEGKGYTAVYTRYPE